MEWGLGEGGGCGHGVHVISEVLWCAQCAMWRFWWSVQWRKGCQVVSHKSVFCAAKMGVKCCALGKVKKGFLSNWGSWWTTQVEDIGRNWSKLIKEDKCLSLVTTDWVHIEKNNKGWTWLKEGKYCKLCNHALLECHPDELWVMRVTN